MEPFQLDWEFEPGIFIGCVMVTIGDERHFIVPPELEDAKWRLPTDGFAEIVLDPDGNWIVDRFSRSVAGMQRPTACWTKEHVESFVRKRMLR